MTPPILLLYPSPGICRVSVPGRYDSGDFDVDDDDARRMHAANARIIADRAGRKERYSKGYTQEKGP